MYSTPNLIFNFSLLFDNRFNDGTTVDIKEYKVNEFFFERMANISQLFLHVYQIALTQDSILQVGFYDDNHCIFESYRDLKVKHFISQRIMFFLFLEILLINVFGLILLECIIFCFLNFQVLIF